MPTFTYKAVNNRKQTVEDSVIAASIADAKGILTGQGFQIISLREQSSKIKSGFSFSKGMPVIEKATLCRYLGTMVEAGLPLPEAVEVYARDTKNSRLRQILFDIQQQLEQGKTLSHAFSKYPDIFDTTVIAILKAGELSGTLSKSLQYLSKQLFAEYKLKQKVKGAMMYPVIIISAMGGVGLILVFFVLPKIAPIFLQMSINLPFTTRVILKGGLFISEKAYIVLPLIFGGLGALIYSLRQSWGKRIAIRIATILPAIKKLLDYIDLARFSRTLSTLLSSSVPITDALLIVVSALSQEKFSKHAKNFQLGVQKGKALSEVLRAERNLFPTMIIRMVATGEKTGAVDTMLGDMAEHYEEEVDSMLANLTSILEPILLLLVGVGVALMVLAVIAPIYSLVGGIEGATPGR